MLVECNFFVYNLVNVHIPKKINLTILPFFIYLGIKILYINNKYTCITICNKVYNKQKW